MGNQSSGPDVVNIKLIFDETSLHLKRVETPGADLPENWGAKIATKWVELFTKNNVGRTILGGTGTCILKPPERSFLYLDVGRWGGKLVPGSILLAGKSEHRDFGIVCGGHAVLCKFSNHPLSIPMQVGSDPASNKIKSLLDLIVGKDSSGKDICGVEVVKWLTIETTLAPTSIPIYIILGDLHIPITDIHNPYPHSQECEDTMGEYNYKVDQNKRIPHKFKPASIPEGPMGRVLDGDYTLLDTRDYCAVSAWCSKYIGGDIFSGGADDLILFLGRIETATKTLPVNFVQAGDLYDFWLGLAPFFQAIAGPPGRVVLSTETLVSPMVLEHKAQEFVNYWIKEANKCNPGLTGKLNTLQVASKTFLYGNHDNYLNAYHPSLNDARIRTYRQDGVYFEHGHWVDPYNYDGGQDGHKTTNRVFDNSFLRDWDPSMRHYFTAGAALEYYDNSNFKIFAMGHTHIPYLTKVNISVECTPSPTLGPNIAIAKDYMNQ
jgi:hypothetical protein